MKFLDIFAGIGGFRLGLERAGHECVGHVEIDKFANQSYAAIHKPKESEVFFEDITRITDEDIRGLRDLGIDIIAGGFPCQAFSIAGKRGGFEDTRGTLFFEIARAAKEIEPSYLFLENVKGLFSHDKGRTFGTIIQTLDELGFITEWGLFNSKFWGVPQNRERVFIVATRKDKWSKPILFDLLKQQEQNGINVKLRDVLETEVDEKFYLSKEQTDRLVFNMSEREKKEDEIKILAHYKEVVQVGGRGHYTMDEPRAIKDKILMRETDDGFHLCRNDEKKSSIQGTHVTYPDGTSHCLSVAHKPMTIEQKTVSYNRKDGIGKEIDVSHTLSASDYRGLNRNQNQNAVVEVAIGASRGRNPENPSDRTTGAPTEQRLEINREGTSNTLTTVQKDNYVIEPALNKLGNIYPSGGQNGNVYDAEGLSPTLSSGTTSTEGNGGIGSNNAPKIGLVGSPSFRIRKLTPLECFRLQGFPDWAFDRAKAAGVSNSQLYKQAGNSVTVNVIEAIGRKLAMEDHS